MAADRQVVYHPAHATDVDVQGDDVGVEALLGRALGHRPVERALAVPDVEQNAARFPERRA
jgi:hypothetical protein